jgi:hypothetical protein
VFENHPLSQSSALKKVCLDEEYNTESDTLAASHAISKLYSILEDLNKQIEVIEARLDTQNKATLSSTRAEKIRNFIAENFDRRMEKIVHAISLLCNYVLRQQVEKARNIRDRLHLPKGLLDTSNDCAVLTSLRSFASSSLLLCDAIEPPTSSTMDCTTAFNLAVKFYHKLYLRFNATEDLLRSCKKFEEDMLRKSLVEVPFSWSSESEAEDDALGDAEGDALGDAEDDALGGDAENIFISPLVDTKCTVGTAWTNSNATEETATSMNTEDTASCMHEGEFPLLTHCSESSSHKLPSVSDSSHSMPDSHPSVLVSDPSVSDLKSVIIESGIYVSPSGVTFRQGGKTHNKKKKDSKILTSLLPMVNKV